MIGFNIFTVVLSTSSTFLFFLIIFFGSARVESFVSPQNVVSEGIISLHSIGFLNGNNNHNNNKGLNRAYFFSSPTTFPTCTFFPSSKLWPLSSLSISNTKSVDSGTKRKAKLQETVEVSLENRSYPIYIGSNLLHEEEKKEQEEVEDNNNKNEESYLRKHINGKQVLIVTNDLVAPLYMEKVIKELKKYKELEIHSLVLPDGEKYKDLPTLEIILNKALESRLDRKCTFIALGGGVIGDMVGFAAAIYQRGVPFIQVPTTLMAMVDSSVGGKTAVNHPLGKNMIGAFYQPQCVLIDTNTLNSLPGREFASGIAEVIKYGLIKDSKLFEWLENNMEEVVARNPNALAYIVQKSCENKAKIVSLDEREGDAGIRATLNLGHTFGHAIENGLGYGQWLHGEAVSMGMVMAVDFSVRMGWVDSSLLKRTINLLKRAKLPVSLNPELNLTSSKFKDTMAIDKKVANGVLRLILVKGELGNCLFTSEYDQNLLEETIADYTDGK